MHYTTHSAAETEALAEQLLSEILNKRVVQLSGNLGSGKTTFVKGLAKALGIEKAVKSPTYTYVQSYQLPTTNYQLLWHFDLYRLPESSEYPDQVAASIGLEDALNDPTALVLIEWPERLPIKTSTLLLQFEKKQNHHGIHSELQ
ncbi:MAG: tRNA (adenosine(37)-N6)-threonylcarbamoyltransferase complex ATPase subunit type 1 TsaE [Candidatus Altimarinota bacterium]